MIHEKGNRRRFLETLVGGAALGGLGSRLASANTADSWPNGPIRFVVPFPPGSGTDRTARLFGAALEKKLGQPIVVENRAGGNGIIAINMVLNAPADGQMILLGSNSALSTNAVALKDLPYDPVKDFTPIARMTMAPCLLAVPPTSPAKTVADLVSMAKKAPGKLNYASGSASYMFYTEWFNALAGIKATKIPYKGSSEAVNAVISGIVDYAVVDSATTSKQASGGLLRPLILTAEQPSPHFPGVPSSVQAGYPEFLAFSWGAAMLKAGTPMPIVTRLRQAFAEVGELPEVKGFYGKSSTAELRMAIGDDFAKFQQEELDRWRRIAQSAGITPT